MMESTVLSDDRIAKPKGVVHFLGGAFVGATGHLSYPLFLRYSFVFSNFLHGSSACTDSSSWLFSLSLADTLPLSSALRPRILVESGYLIICTPYKVTFKHLDCAAGVRARFLDTLSQLALPPSTPTLGVGHSNGALLHGLSACLFNGIDDRHVGNVLISYNNRPISEAIPIPGFLEQITPVANLLESAGVRYARPEP